VSGRQFVVDSTAIAPRNYAESIGFTVVSVNGVIHCMLISGTRGAPITCITAPRTTDTLKAELSSR